MAPGADREAGEPGGRRRRACHCRARCRQTSRSARDAQRRWANCISWVTTSIVMPPLILVDLALAEVRGAQRRRVLDPVTSETGLTITRFSTRAEASNVSGRTNEAANADARARPQS